MLVNAMGMCETLTSLVGVAETLVVTRSAHRVFHAIACRAHLADGVGSAINRMYWLCGMSKQNPCHAQRLVVEGEMWSSVAMR